MTHQTPEEIAIQWWSAIDRAEFGAASALLAPDAVVDWPLSNERMRDSGAWRAVNERYPGRWSAHVRSIVTEGDTVVTLTNVADGGITVVAISYFTIRDGAITRLVEYWPESYAAPGWRAEFVVPIPDSVAEAMA